MPDDDPKDQLPTAKPPFPQIPGLEDEEDEGPPISTTVLAIVQILGSQEAREAVKALAAAWAEARGHSTRQAGWQIIFASVCVVAIVASVVLLSWSGPMDPTAGVILGSLAGYLFGRRQAG